MELRHPPPSQVCQETGAWAPSKVLLWPALCLCRGWSRRTRKHVTWPHMPLSPGLGEEALPKTCLKE